MQHNTLEHEMSPIAADTGRELFAGSLRRCPYCGTTLERVHSEGLMGCAMCYVAFSDVVGQVLFALFGSSKHTGKTL